jgi:hypothetical protein
VPTRSMLVGSGWERVVSASARPGFAAGVSGAAAGVQVGAGVHVGEGAGVHVGEGVQAGAGAAARVGAAGASGADRVSWAGHTSWAGLVSWAGRVSAAGHTSWAGRVSRAGLVSGDRSMSGVGRVSGARTASCAGSASGPAGVTGAAAPIRRLAQAGLRMGWVRAWAAGRSSWPGLVPDDSRSSRTQPESADTGFPTLSIGKGLAGSFRVSEASAPRGPSTTSVTNASRLSRSRPAASFLLVSPADVRRQAELPRLNSPNFDSGGPDSLSGVYTCGCR